MNYWLDIIRLEKDFGYFFEKCTDHKLYDCQKRYVKCLIDNREVICKKYRSGGFTTINVLWSLWNAMFNGETNMIVTGRCIDANWLYNFTLRHLRKVPNGLANCNIIQNHRITFNNNGILYFYNAESSSSRGCAIDRLYLDEPAFWKNADNTFKCLYPTLSSTSSLSIASTVNGKSGNGEWFFQRYSYGKFHGQPTVFKTIYTDCPYYKTIDLKQLKAALGEEGWKQEVLCEFVEPMKYDD